MHMDPVLPLMAELALLLLVIAFLSKKLKQPTVVGYIFAGVIIGPFGFKLITDPQVLSRLGQFGVLLLLFFVGMEISLPRLVAKWRVAVLGTLFQILANIGITYLIGLWLDWPLYRVVLLGFVISLSSTSVVLKILHDWDEIDTPAGQDVLGILLAQDLALIPMIIVIDFLGGETPTADVLIPQIIGGVLITLLFIWLIYKGKFRLPLARFWRGDHEMEIFFVLVLFLGLSFLTGALHLSAALGAFIAGILVSMAKETQWAHTHLEPYRAVFIAIFFVSIGLLIDINFIYENLTLVSILVGAILVINTVFNSVIIRFFGINWRQSFYSGALLGQIGEFSFVLASVGLAARIITQYSYQLTITVITLSLLISPAWIIVIKKVTKCDGKKQHIEA